MNEQKPTPDQLQIIGNLAAGYYREAAAIAFERGDTDLVLFAMQAAFRDGFREALDTVNKVANEDLKRHKNVQALFKGWPTP